MTQKDKILLVEHVTFVENRNDWGFSMEGSFALLLFFITHLLFSLSLIQVCWSPQWKISFHIRHFLDVCMATLFTLYWSYAPPLITFIVKLILLHIILLVSLSSSLDVIWVGESPPSIWSLNSLNVRIEFLTSSW